MGTGAGYPEEREKGGASYSRVSPIYTLVMRPRTDPLQLKAERCGIDAGQFLYQFVFGILHIKY
jgi:hypothetical protein